MVLTNRRYCRFKRLAQVWCGLLADIPTSLSVKHSLSAILFQSLISRMIVQVGLAKSKRNKSKQIFCFKERKISLKVTDHTQPVMDAGWVPQSDGGKPANDSVCLEE